MRRSRKQFHIFCVFFDSFFGLGETAGAGRKTPIRGQSKIAIYKFDSSFTPGVQLVPGEEGKMKRLNFTAMYPVMAGAIEQMMAEQGSKFLLKKVNPAEMEPRTGISCARLRRMKEYDC